MPTDRELQDEVIRYLTDARSQPSPVLGKSEAEKAQRFSRFLARRYYRDRLHRAFRYSRKFPVEMGHAAALPATGENPEETQHAASLPGSIATPEDIVDSAKFDAFLAHCVLGSLASAREVGELALSKLLQTKLPGPWWHEVLQYEFAFFVQLATSEIDVNSSVPFPRLGNSTIVREFSWRMPQLLASVKSRQTPSEALIGRSVLLFSRSHHGKIYVVELDATATALLDAIDGKRTVAEITSQAAIPATQAQQILASLEEIGAVLLPASG